MSASIDQLVIKFPTLADIQRQSGLVEVAVREIRIELEILREEEQELACDDEQAGAGLARQHLAASLSALGEAFTRDVHSAYEDAPDAELDASAQESLPSHEHDNPRQTDRAQPCSSSALPPNPCVRSNFGAEAVWVLSCLPRIL